MTEKQFIKFPSIEQFRNCVSTVSATSEHYEMPLPTINFKGTVKLHGTNAGVVMSPDGDVYAQSRNNILSLEKDNAGFAFFVEKNKEVFTDLLNCVAENTKEDYITIFGEWCGAGIQKGVGISELDKMFVIFGCKVGEEWVDYYHLEAPEYRIFNIQNFPTYEMDIDFSNAKLSTNKLVEITEAVEAECPVAKAFGVSGIGEGVVWTADWKGKRLMFKVKGEKHSSSKVKKLATVDTEKLENIQKFVEYSVTENRLNQAIEQVFTINSIEPSIKLTGDFLGWVVRDILKEELDTMIASGLEPKQVNGEISKHARQWWLNYLNR